MKKIIVTGITGQDGSYMVDFLLENTEHMIYGMVRRCANPNYKNIQHVFVNPRFKLVIGDLSDSSSIESLVREIQPDYFINFAAQSFVGSSWQIPEQTFDVVAGGVIRCLEAIRKHAPQCRFYSAGSSEEMGDVLYSPQDKEHPIRPRSPYGAAKAAARHITKVWRESYGLYAIHSILYNHESERRGEEFVSRKISKGVARIAKAIKEGRDFEPIELGNLDAKRDWSHARDFVKGVWMMLNQELYNGTLNQHCKQASKLAVSYEDPEKKFNDWLSIEIKEYILASGETHPVREFVEKAFRIAGIEGKWTGNGIEEYFYIPYGLPITKLVTINPKFYRPAEVELLLGDSTPIRQELGWKPDISFDELVRLMVWNDLKEAGL